MSTLNITYTILGTLLTFEVYILINYLIYDILKNVYNKKFKNFDAFVSVKKTRKKYYRYYCFLDLFNYKKCYNNYKYHYLKNRYEYALNFPKDINREHCKLEFLQFEREYKLNKIKKQNT